MNIASIDIGSNTVLLLIGEIKNNELSPIINISNSPRLGKGLIPGAKIKKDRIDNLLKILTEYKMIIEKHNCQRTILTATNAMRIASNSKEIVSLIKKRLNFDVKIIPGEEEAVLSYMGASSSYPNFKEKVVIDIGGGSTEIIYGNKNDILFKNSFQTGVVSLTEMFLTEFPYKNDSILRVHEYLNQTFSLIENNIPKSVPIIAVAGTPTTLSCIVQNIKIYHDKKVEGSFLTDMNFDSLFKTLIEMPGIEIKKRFGNVVEGREDVLFAGLLILDFLRRSLKSDRINVSSRGLRYGNIINYIN